MIWFKFLFVVYDFDIVNELIEGFEDFFIYYKFFMFGIILLIERGFNNILYFILVIIVYFLCSIWRYGKLYLRIFNLIMIFR